ncbi:hypothetical protein PHJA_002956600 [Phtheirospermum japonicum]|uniref:Uncharacterized protein n=1 Tax=Phtheirospermum japonicum TaxID=374723 RepID=A0A830DN14_9LAMI|nr:hypothetical protein PHJA_002956600 [Phtheirospermum japonicum]
MSKVVDDDPWKQHKLAFVERLRDTNDCALFPPKYDFKNVCSCDECSSIIGQLKEFEQDLKSKSKQASEGICKRSVAGNNCFNLSAASGCSVDILDLLRHNLKVVYAKLGLSFTLGGSKCELKDVELKIQGLISDNGLMLGGDNDVDDLDETILVPSKTICQIIIFGLHLYSKTKVKEEAHHLLNEVLRLERMHEAAQISAEGQGEMLDPLISKRYIEQQIEGLPVEKLIPEVEDEIDKVSHITRNVDKLVEAKSCILGVSRYMVGTRNVFWQEYQEKHKGITGHDSTGLKDTLEKLRDKANWFKAEWNKDYAHWVAPYERSDPKRQRAQ